MKLRIEKHDIMKIKRDKWYYAHWTDGEFSGRNSTLDFIHEFNIRNDLNRYIKNFGRCEAGHCIYTMKRIFTVVNTNYYYKMPTKESMMKSIVSLSKYCKMFNVKYLAIHESSWDLIELKSMLEEVFKDVDIEILICTDKVRSI